MNEITNVKVKKQPSELDMEQQTGSKSGKEYVKAVYCHPAYLTYMQSTLCEMPGCMKHKLESRLLGEKSITSDTQMTLPFAIKICLVKAMIFLVVTYGCESWTIKKAEHQRIDVFELGCWRRFLRASWICKEIQTVNPKGNWTDY